MTEPLIHDLDQLMAAFDVRTVADLALSIEEAADIDDGQTVFIDDQGDAVTLGIGTHGLDIEFPTTVRHVLELAADVESPESSGVIITCKGMGDVLQHIDLSEPT